ncbi:MAG: type II toxin-antitoxin system HicB family antitoxin [Candidatus Accumulibacter sp.]|jgi:predicted RNase H-like HicB family nuclease|nr:type II toxin-antitoxin system HicB family antitoxin [Accumulibacter sp.]
MKTEIKRIARAAPLWPFEAYTHVIRPLAADEGGGFLLTLPDIPGCMSDGETEAEALENGRDAFIAVVSALQDMGREIPAPAFRADGVDEKFSGKFVTRLPRTLHARLAARAKAEGVSLNTLVLSFIASGMGGRQDGLR